MKTLLHGIASALLVSTLFVPDVAEACGGCFVQQSDNTVVTGHRMALSISPTQTVLWDQFQYAGAAEDFAWVLPVKQGARVELSSDAWFEVLEAGTVTNVLSPQLNCGGSSGGFGCSAQADAAGAYSAENGNDAVTVVHQGTVGPYETVTLHANEPGALNQWLDSHNYAVDADTQPIIDAYVQEGFDFIALKLIPGNDVSLMKPVRVVTNGASGTLPLRMVAAGTGANVPIVLYVISEGRYEAQSFPNAKIPFELVSWDYSAQQSNYAEVRAAVLGAGAGDNWITTYSQPGALLSPIINPYGFGLSVQYQSSFGFVDTIAASYFAQAYANAETDVVCDGTDIGIYASSSAVVVDPCQDGDLGCPSSGSGLDFRKLMCGDQRVASDIGRAMVGLHPKDVWVTRMEANLPRAALAKDLTVTASESQVAQSNYVQAQIKINADTVCPSGVPVIQLGGDDANKNTGALLGLGLLATALLGLASRRTIRHYA